jgi:amidase
MVTEDVFAPAHVLARAIQHREVSSAEIVDAYLAQIARHNAQLNAIVTLDEEGARRRAQEADAALARGEVWGPLHGVPITLKDFHAVAGMRCTSGGHPPLTDHVPTEDSTVPARLKAAGTIILGMTNAEFFEERIFDPANNPWDPSRTPGTSSSGAAAALAAGLTSLDFCSDMGGSITVPSHYCGLFGMRPTEHRVSMAGVIYSREPAPIFRAMAVLGPMARSAEDLGLALRVVAGLDVRDPDVPPIPWREVRRPSLDELRIAWTPDFDGQETVAEDIRDAVEGLARELDRLGARVERRLPEVDLVEQTRLFLQLGGYIVGAFPNSSEDGSPVTLGEYFIGLHRRDSFIASWEQFFADWDVLLCPADLFTAPRHGEAEPDYRVHPADLFSLTGHPSVVIPLERDHDGVPIGMQMVGRRWNDERVLAIAESLSEQTGGFRRLPGY